MQGERGRIFLLMGYFGSGKTTFIRALLKGHPSQKYAIIQNQFAQGQMGIEKGLITDESGTPFSEFLELPNGCICCSAKNDLIAAIEYILDNTAVRNIVVETNGIAQPAQSIKQFWFDEGIHINAVLHSVIAVISAKRWSELQQQQLLIRQIVYANRVLITFVDCVLEDKVKEIIQQVRGINSNCVIEKNNSYVMGQFMRGDALFDLKNIESTYKESKKHGLKSVFVKGKCRVDNKLEFQKLMGELLWESKMRILRIKGVICIANEEYVFELQGVDDIFQVKQSKTKVEKYEHTTKILIIGEQLNVQQLYIALNIVPMNDSK